MILVLGAAIAVIGEHDLGAMSISELLIVSPAPSSLLLLQSWSQGSGRRVFDASAIIQSREEKQGMPGPECDRGTQRTGTGK